MSRQTFPIDVVYCWCGSPETKYCMYNKDIHYSIKSVQKFMPWVRTIWITVPDKCDYTKLPKASNIKTVKESDFVPKQFLPVLWNSNVIESWIWRIDGIAEHFVYFCDDMFVGQKVKRGDFFLQGKPVLRIYDGKPDYPPLSVLKTQKLWPNHGDYVRMWAGVVEEYNFHYTRIQHQALPYRKSHMERFYNQYESKIKLASKNKTRNGEHDFNLLRFTSALSVMHGLSYLIVTFDDHDFFTESDDVIRIKQIFKKKPTFFCINNSSMASGEKLYYKEFETLFGK